MKSLDQKICAWGGLFCTVTLVIGLLVAGFVPPPSPALDAAHVAAIYLVHAGRIGIGSGFALVSIIGYITLIAAISAQLQRIKGISSAIVYLQLAAGAINAVTIMLPMMIFAVAAFRPNRDPNLTQMLNDLGWLITVPAYPTFIAQLGAIALAIYCDQRAMPVFPRWAAIFNVVVAISFIPAGLAYFYLTGPFAWDGLFPFWIAGGSTFAWLLIMTWLVLTAINQESLAEQAVPEKRAMPAQRHASFR